MCSIPFGLLIGKFFQINNIREHGSGNIGATNAFRVGGKKMGAFVLLLDSAKGAAGTGMALYFFNPEVAALSFVICVLGHTFPIWLKFKGGKGVATTIGGLIALDQTLCIIAIAAWLIVFCISKISSLSSLISISITTIFASITLPNTLFLAQFAVCSLLFFTHKSNIFRLLNKSEPKIGIISKL